VELVAFTLEEQPHFHTAQMGSAVHVASLTQQGIPVRVMFSLEMIGYFTDAPQSQSFPLPFLAAFYPSQGNFIALVGNLSQGLVVRSLKKAMQSASPLPVYSINAPRFVPGVDFSDHRNYWQAGYNAVMVTDTAFYRNPHYHTLQDTADRLDYDRMAMVVQGVYAAVVRSAFGNNKRQDLEDKFHISYWRQNSRDPRAALFLAGQLLLLIRSPLSRNRS
jgi:hypothetical protein